MSTSTIILYLLKHGFTDIAYEDKTFFCPYCIHIEGLLSAFPIICGDIEIRYVDFEKPRGALAKYSGSDNQSCPQIILPNGDDKYSIEYTQNGIANVKRIDNTRHILDYLSKRFGLPIRHP